MSAILFGSISTIADTSELQRQSFNDAFQAHGLDWNWGQEEYRALLEQSGGEKRIAQYASSLGQSVDAGAVHQTKSENFLKRLAESRLPARSGVVEAIQEARDNGFKVALVTTTSPENVSSLIEAMRPNVETTTFDLIVDSSAVGQAKPDRASYAFALETLNESADGCVAIEDNLDGVKAARAAGLECVAFPNENTAHHNFEKASRRLDLLSFSELQALIPGS